MTTPPQDSNYSSTVAQTIAAYIDWINAMSKPRPPLTEAEIAEKEFLLFGIQSFAE